ncbi:unnamed protein product [Clonostachys rosea]|uniref:Glutathionylspermidine synthase pre-ATP-grasp-like domain-containing protein n=1 Tax=Bionectria ochroleuca TaxID=29856 RepID=A0ABY6U8V1_BIOOC|nr:unnamed protein product [Clonostachys rosea]
MRRVSIEPRPNHTKLVQSQGLVYAKTAGDDYWPDDRYYSFTSEEIELLAKAGKDVFDMCCEAAEAICKDPTIMTEKMAIPEFAVEQIIKSWDRDPACGSVYGRFDVCFGGLDHPDERLRTPKFYEFNADTPTSLLESAIVQWHWLEQTGNGKDQFNSIFDDLMIAWKRNLTEAEKVLGHAIECVYFAASKGDDSGEDAINTTVLMEACSEAGWNTESIFLQDIVFHKEENRYYDKAGKHIDVIFKLWPWEWMAEDDGERCFKDMANIGEHTRSGEYVGGTLWFEAPYKMLWSNKALFPILWDMFKDDPRGKYLLSTYFEDEAPETLTKYCRKAIFAREGAGITLKDGENVIQDTPSEGYGKEGYIVQELCQLPKFEDGEGNSTYAVLGLWMVDGEPSGMGIREDRTLVTGNKSTFVPHSISDGEVTYKRKAIPTLEDIDRALTMTAEEKETPQYSFAQGLFPADESPYVIVRASEFMMLVRER